jgi:hypothetical protein
VVAAVAAAYYGERPGAARERLRPLVDVIERAAPGTVVLHRAADTGFGIALAGRPFPHSHEGELRAAVEEVLSGWSAAASGAGRGPGLFARLAGALRRLFKAGA